MNSKTYECSARNTVTGETYEFAWDAAARQWRGIDGAFTASSTEQQIIDEQWAWESIREALEDDEMSGEFFICGERYTWGCDAA